MGENTTIEWCDHTFNPWRGCQKVAAGCANCYAEAQAKRNSQTLGVWGPNGTRVVASESAWKQVEKWDKAVRCICDAPIGRGSMEAFTYCPKHKPGAHLPSVFCGSMCDVFEDWEGQCLTSKREYANEQYHLGTFTDYVGCVLRGGNNAVRLPHVRQRLFRLIDATRLTWLLLTKRPQNIRRMMPSFFPGGYIAEAGTMNQEGPRANVYLGTSIACRADLQNADELAKCRDLCRGTFWSLEPLIEDLGDISSQLRHVQQVIIGGESGPNARPCDVAWIRSIVRQCADARVSCFVKQLGANVIGSENELHEIRNICIDRRPGTDAMVLWPLRDKKGGDPDEWPEDVRVRQLIWKGGA